MLQHEIKIASYNPFSFSELRADTQYHKVFTFFVDGVEHDLIYRSAKCAVSVNDFGTFCYAYNKETKKFIPVVCATSDAVLKQLVQGGVSAITNVGKYLFIAGNTITPTWSPTSAYDNVDNRSKAAAWVRGGAYSRTFKVTVTKLDGTTIIGTYKTVSASYLTLLSTSDILTSDPDYQKKVNDRVNAYNGEVTKWIGTSAADITPENIAQKLVDSLTGLGLTGVSRLDSTVLIDNDEVKDIACDDSGDGSLLRGVGNQLSAAELVSAIHYVGKVVKIRPKGTAGDDAFYLKAQARDGVGTGWQQVAWRESAGYIMTPETVFCFGTVVNGTLYLASSAAGLTSLAGGTHPNYKASVVGDDVSSPLPTFFGQTINYLGLHQDRLVIGSGSTILVSRPGDYLNWFRQSVLTQPANDPWEGYALGAEDDTIRYSTTYDRNLVLYGERFQYQISGRTTLDPKTASIVTTSAYKDANDAAPQASGNFVFYAKYSSEDENTAKATSLHQVQAGVVADAPESFEVSQQLDSYIRGKPVQIACIEAPNLVVVRTDEARDRIYTYGYLDTAAGSERLFDSWSSWTWSPEVGQAVGVGITGTSVLVYLLRNDGVNTWMAAEKFSLSAGPSKYPRFDSIRPYASILADGGSADTHTPNMLFAFGDTSEFNLIGTPVSKLPQFLIDYPNQSGLWGGFNMPAYVTPTNPFYLDRNGKAVISGMLTLGQVVVAVEKSGGLIIEVTDSSRSWVSKDFSGSLLGQNVPLGKQPLATTNVTALVGREVRACSYTLRAKKWLPLTITAIGWSGQYFNNARRVG